MIITLWVNFNCERLREATFLLNNVQLCKLASVFSPSLSDTQLIKQLKCKFLKYLSKIVCKKRTTWPKISNNFETTIIMMLLYINLHWFRNTFSREERQAQHIKLSNFKIASILQEEPDTGNVRPSRSNSMADEWVLSFYWVNYVFFTISPTD